jgi:hypothetical protein
MSYISINPQFLNKTINISRKTTTRDAYGGLTESWLTVYNGIKANVQESDNKQLVTESGEEVLRTHLAYLAPKDGSSNLVLLEGDKLFDRSSNLTYKIIGVRRSFNKEQVIHHNRLDLEVLREDPTVFQDYQVSSKARITLS